MTAGSETNCYELTHAILQEAAQAPESAMWFRAATTGKELLVRRVVTITTSEYPTPVRGPAYSVLSNSNLNRVFGNRVCRQPPYR